MAYYYNVISRKVHINDIIISCFRQGRLEDFQQTLHNEYVDFTTPATIANGINIKIQHDPQMFNNIYETPKNLLGEY